MFCVKNLHVKKIYNAGEGGLQVLNLLLQNVCLSKTKSIKICENIRKLQFASLFCQTACFKKLLNLQKNMAKCKIFKENR